MANRRQFLAGSVVSTAFITSTAARAGAMISGSEDKRIAAFVFDERVEQSLNLARQFDPRRSRLYAINGDVSEVWFSLIAPALAHRTQAIGGLTNVGGMFVLARLGHDAGLTLALHGTHYFAPDDSSGQHTLEAPDLIKHQYEAALSGGSTWMHALQSALASVAAMQSEGRKIISSSIPFDMATRTTLHSWLLVPRG